MNDEPWYEQAACRSENREMFFVDDKDSRATLPAKRICLECPVRMQCLRLGMAQYYGIYGGTTVYDRGRIRRGLRQGKTLREMLQRIDATSKKRMRELGI